MLFSYPVASFVRVAKELKSGDNIYYRYITTGEEEINNIIYTVF